MTQLAKDEENRQRYKERLEQIEEKLRTDSHLSTATNVVPESLDQLVEFDPDQFKGLDESFQTGDAESDSDIETLEESDQIEFKPEPITISEMAQTVTEFIRLATSLIPEFDGRHENLQSFLDALGLLDSLKGAHETTAVSLIKTKLKGHARNLISNEQTINEIIAQLSTAVKGESVEVISAKLLNLQQKNKTANQYTRGGRGYNRDRNNYHNNYNRGSSYNNNNYNYRGGRRGQNQGRGRVNSNQSNNNNNVRMLQNTSENSQNPLGNNQ
ncbi:GATOR complex protein WDR24-like [Drosophila teissieri]|uniref:GATOR complex protein WDR24-like n=1 Tax=Drosophila teissieri TaxID=7243 RepID=UPI001CBA405A|nr:GATOR complex protein WDR24-like [Drosophila teissieri]